MDRVGIANLLLQSSIITLGLGIFFHLMVLMGGLKGIESAERKKVRQTQSAALASIACSILFVHGLWREASSAAAYWITIVCGLTAAIVALLYAIRIKGPLNTWLQPAAALLIASWILCFAFWRCV